MHLIPRAWRDSAMPCTVHTFRPFPDPSRSADNMHCTHASWLELCYESSILSGHLDSFKPATLPVLSRTSERTDSDDRRVSPAFSVFTSIEEG